MAITTIELPLYSEKRYRYSTNIEGQSWQLTFRWNQRAGQWHLDLHKEDQTPVLLGQALVSQYPMFLDYNLEDFGLTGYFLLIPINTSVATKLSDGYSIMPQFFSLFYIYNTPD